MSCFDERGLDGHLMYFILDENNEPQPRTLGECIQWIKSMPNTIATGVGKKLWHWKGENGLAVSTVFITHNLTYNFGECRCFESLIYGGDRDGETQNYATYQEALDGHMGLVNELTEAVQ